MPALTPQRCKRCSWVRCSKPVRDKRLHDKRLFAAMDDCRPLETKQDLTLAFNALLSSREEQLRNMRDKFSALQETLAKHRADAASTQHALVQKHAHTFRRVSELQLDLQAAHGELLPASWKRRDFDIVSNKYNVDHATKTRRDRTTAKRAASLARNE